MTALAKYLRRSPTARVAMSIRRQCLESHVGLLTRHGLQGVLERRFKTSTVSRVLTELPRVAQVRCYL
jgi:hypothetical protein